MFLLISRDITRSATGDTSAVHPSRLPSIDLSKVSVESGNYERKFSVINRTKASAEKTRLSYV